MYSQAGSADASTTASAPELGARKNSSPTMHPRTKQLPGRGPVQGSTFARAMSVCRRRTARSGCGRNRDPGRVLTRPCRTSRLPFAAQPQGDAGPGRRTQNRTTCPNECPAPGERRCRLCCRAGPAAPSGPASARQGRSIVQDPYGSRGARQVQRNGLAPTSRPRPRRAGIGCCPEALSRSVVCPLVRDGWLRVVPAGGQGRGSATGSSRRAFPVLDRGLGFSSSGVPDGLRAIVPEGPSAAGWLAGPHARLNRRS